MSRVILRNERRSGAGRVLWLLLAAALLVPAATAVAARLRHGPWSPLLRLLAGLALLLAITLAVHASRGAGGRRLVLGVLRNGLWVGVLSVVLARIVHLRANAYFTRAVLFEGMLVIALAHLVGVLLERVARELRRRRTSPSDLVARAALQWRGPEAGRRALRRVLDRPLPTAERLGDFVLDVVASFVAAHWIAAALGQREVGLVLLMAAGAGMALVLLLRVAALLSAIAGPPTTAGADHLPAPPDAARRSGHAHAR